MGTLLESYGQGGDVITIHDPVASFTTPTVAGTGISVERWQRGGAGPTAVELELGADKATVLTGPFGLYATRADDSVAMAGVIGDGGDIIVPNAVVRVAFRVNVGGAKKLQIAPIADASNLTGRTATASNSAVITVKAIPIFSVIA